MKIEILNITWKQRYQIEKLLSVLSSGKDGYILFHKDTGFTPTVKVEMMPLTGDFVTVEGKSGISEWIDLDMFGETILINSE